MYTLHKTLCPPKIVPHAADRCAVILVPAFWGKSPRNKDEGSLLFILYTYIFFGFATLSQEKNAKQLSSKEIFYYLEQNNQQKIKLFCCWKPTEPTIICLLLFLLMLVMLVHA